MKTWLLFFTLLFVLKCQSYAQSQELFLGSGTGTSIVATTGHNFIVTSNYFGQISVMKIDSSGNHFWQKNFGLTTGMSPDNMALQILRITDNKFLIIGKYDPGIGGYYKAYVIMIDSIGNTIWENVYGNNSTIGRCAFYDSLNSAIYITGNSQVSTSDIYVLKIGIAGNLIREFYIDLGGVEVGENIISVSPNEIIISGNSDVFSSGDYDGFILNLDSSGNTTWLKSYGGQMYDHFSDLHRTPDGGFLVLGTTSSFGSGLADAWIVKTNNLGDTLWTRTIGFATTELAYHFTFENENSIWFCGKRIEDTLNNSQGWIVQIDSIGILLSSKLYGNSRDEIFYSLITDGNSVYALGESATGINDMLIYLVRQDSIELLSNINYTEILIKPVVFPNPTTDYADIIFHDEIDLCSSSIFLVDAMCHFITPKLEERDKRLRIYMPYSSGIYFLKIYSKDKTYSIPIIKN